MRQAQCRGWPIDNATSMRYSPPRSRTSPFTTSWPNAPSPISCERCDVGFSRNGWWWCCSHKRIVHSVNSGAFSSRTDVRWRSRKCVLAKDERVALDVVREKGPRALQARLVARWSPEEEQYKWLVTNLSRERFTAHEAGQVYRLRWQVERMFKEWKSYANLHLHAFDTSNAGIAQGLIWTAIAASILKRYLGQMTRALRGVEISTREAAMCARHGLDGLFRVLATEKSRGLLPVLRRLIDYLASNAARAHPKRDRKRGRLQFGLVPKLEAA